MLDTPLQEQKGKRGQNPKNIRAIFCWAEKGRKGMEREAIAPDQELAIHPTILGRKLMEIEEYLYLARRFHRRLVEEQSDGAASTAPPPRPPSLSLSAEPAVRYCATGESFMLPTWSRLLQSQSDGDYLLVVCPFLFIFWFVLICIPSFLCVPCSWLGNAIFWFLFPFNQTAVARFCWG